VTTLFQALYTLSFTAVDRVKALKDEEKGASAVEYALLIGVLAAVIIAALVTFGGRITALFGNIVLNAPAPAAR
jgi:pilus assembly protein Flp/PilA